MTGPGGRLAVAGWHSGAVHATVSRALLRSLRVSHCADVGSHGSRSPKKAAGAPNALTARHMSPTHALWAKNPPCAGRSPPRGLTRREGCSGRANKTHRARHAAQFPVGTTRLVGVIAMSRWRNRRTQRRVRRLWERKQRRSERHWSKRGGPPTLPRGRNPDD